MEINQLKQLQAVQLEMYKDVAKFCKEHDIEFYGSWGTALGAIRHQGYIPWDDDIDISMKYDQYVKFKELFLKNKEDKYFLQDSETDIYSWQAYMKVRLNDTTSMEPQHSYLKCHYGICMDIFVLSAIPNSKYKRKVQNLQVSLLRNVANIPYILYYRPNGNTKKDKVLGLIPTSLKMFLAKYLVGNKQLYKFQTYLTKQVNKYDFKDCDYCAEIMEAHFDKYYPSTMFDNIIEVPFEDTTIPVVADYDTYLKTNYNNYLTLPPEEDRIGHGEAIIDFNNSYTKYQSV